MQRHTAGNRRLVKLIVPASCREVILRKIVSFGTDRSFLFPDLDGAAAHINWMMDNPLLVVDAVPGYHQDIEHHGGMIKKNIEEGIFSADGAIAELEKEASLLDSALTEIS